MLVRNVENGHNLPCFPFKGENMHFFQFLIVMLTMDFF